MSQFHCGKVASTFGARAAVLWLKNGLSEEWVYLLINAAWCNNNTRRSEIAASAAWAWYGLRAKVT